MLSARTKTTHSAILGWLIHDVTARATRDAFSSGDYLKTSVAASSLCPPRLGEPRKCDQLRRSPLLFEKSTRHIKPSVLRRMVSASCTLLGSPRPKCTQEFCQIPPLVSVRIRALLPQKHQLHVNAMDVNVHRHSLHPWGKISHPKENRRPPACPT